MPDATPLATVTNSYSYDYESGNAAPTSGQCLQHTTLSSFSINETDHGGTNQAAFLSTLNNSCWFILNGVTYNILTASAASGVLTLTVSPPVIAGSYGVTTIKFVSPDQSTTVGQPLKAPIIPPPLISNPPPPAFPPPSAVPVGPLVGPAIAPAAVPPSIAGQPLISFRTGSATSPPANGYFTQFTTTPYAGFPNQPPNGVPIVFTNTNNFAVAATGQTPPFTWPAPPSTATTAQITINGYAPVWSGTAVMSVQETASAGAIHQRNAGPPQRRRRPVLHRPDTHP